LSNYSGNSPVVTRIGDEAVIVGRKKICRASDGSEICESNLNIWGDLTPVIENGIIYNSSRFRGWEEMVGVLAVKLPANTQKGAAATVLWDPPGKDVSMPLRGLTYTIASPLCVDGIFYGVDMTGGIMAVDVNAKKSVYRQWLDGYDRYNRYV